MQASDFDQIMAIQAQAYGPAMVESDSVVMQRMQQAPTSNWVTEDADGISAYLFAYPSQQGKLTQLGAAFDIAVNADCLYLHDLAVATRARGYSCPQVLLQAAWAKAEEMCLPYSALVSVQETWRYWARYGYIIADPDNAEEYAKLATYTAPACYMLKQFAFA